tara:strand:+ start:14868 stop:15347 length:480 start_codon:yes stop_codon:yes gene_type:complete
MRLYVTDENQYQLLGWSAERAGVVNKWPDETYAFGIRDADAPSDPLRAVLAYNAFYGFDCHMHIASDHTRRWATRATLAVIFGYPFLVRKVRRVTLQFSQNNEKVSITGLKVGFKFEGIKRAGMEDGSDAIVMGMLAQECRWIEQPSRVSNGQEQSTIR